MALEYDPPGLRSGPMRHAPAVEDAAVVMHREVVTAMRNLATHILATADHIEAKPFDDAAIVAACERSGRLEARVMAAVEKFQHARFCTGGIQ